MEIERKRSRRRAPCLPPLPPRNRLQRLSPLTRTRPGSRPRSGLRCGLARPRRASQKDHSQLDDEQFAAEPRAVDPWRPVSGSPRIPRRQAGRLRFAVTPRRRLRVLAVQNEGIDVADRFNAERTTVFVLTYRLPTEGWANRSQVPLQDAQRATRLIRARAAEWRIDPARLEVVGFSTAATLRRTSRFPLITASIRPSTPLTGNPRDLPSSA